MFRIQKLIDETETLCKHRDYEHNSFFEHEMANGGSIEIDPQPVMVRYNPITETALLPTELYFFVDMALHTGMTYTFLVSAESDDSRPTEIRIQNEINKTVKTRVEGGRDWYNYLDLEDPITLMNDRVRERIEAGDIQENPRLGRRSPITAFWDEE